MLTFLRRTILPLGVWLGVMGTAGYLWMGMRGGNVRGFVEGLPYGVAAPQPGLLTAVLVAPGQRVRAGDPIAQLDDREITAELAAVAAERRRVQAELGAVTAETELRVGESSRGIEETVESADIAREQARAERSVASAELSALDSQIAATRELVEKRMADRRELAELGVRQAALKRQIQVADGLIRKLDAQAASARSRRGDLPADATVRATDPLRAELDVLGAQIEQLQARRDSLTLRAPADGEVTAVLLRPGEVVPAGGLVATIAGPALATSDGAPIVYVCGHEGDGVEVGTIARLAPPEGGGTVLTARVERVAPEISQLPQRCWRDPRVPQWGRGVYLAVDDKIALAPGQSFSVQFTDDPSPRAASTTTAPTPPVSPVSPGPHAPATNPVAAAEPRPMLVPASLSMRSRFEPSGLTWVAALDRYIVVSDDTGLEDRDEHAPWLFTMDATGKVDPEPLVVTGVDALSDLEAIAPAPDGVYVLASQSRSKKGKRSPARQFFGRIAIDGASARVVASVELATALDAASPELRATLGLDGTALLDIEGLAATRRGGLLLGLKGPVSDAGATIWHMASPDAFLASGDLASAGLVRLGQLAVTVRADGADVPGGVADLLEVDDGALLVAVTAATTEEPKTQDGALYRLASPQASAELVRTFPGRKAEGIARGATADTLAIVFDAGAAAPTWLEQAWPAR